MDPTRIHIAQSPRRGPRSAGRGEKEEGEGIGGEGLGSESSLVSSGGRLPSSTEIGEGGYHGETYGAE